MRILITGSSGFIGHKLFPALLYEGHTIFGLDVVDYTCTWFEPFFFKADIREPNSLSIVFEKTNPEVVFHLAANKDVRKSVSDTVSDADTNLLGTINVAQLCLKHNARLIFTSSGGCVYGDNVLCPTFVTAPCEPSSPYGLSKYSAEQYLKLFHKLHGLNYTILRLANVYGPDLRPEDKRAPSDVISIFINTLLKKESVKITGTGTQTRDFIYIDDCIHALMAVLNTDPGKHVNRVFNIGTGIATSINTVLQMVAKKCHIENPDIIYTPEIIAEQHNSCLDITDTENILSWKPAVSLQEGITKTVGFYA